MHPENPYSRGFRPMITVTKPILLLGWLEQDGGSSARGGMNDALCAPDGSFLAFPDVGAAMAFLTKKIPLVINVAQVFDISTGKFEEFERIDWKPRQIKSPTVVAPPTPPTPPKP